MAEKKVEVVFDDLRSSETPPPDFGDELEKLGDQEIDGGEEAGEQGEDAAAKPDEDGEYDPVKMTKAMKARILRERRRFDRVLAEKMAEKEAEFRAELDKIRKETARSTVDDDDFDSTELESQIEQAMERGDSKAVASLTKKLADATAEVRMKRLLKDRGPVEELDQEPAKKGPKAGTDDRPKLIPRAQEWVDAQEWWNDPNHAHVRQVVQKVDRKLLSAGYSPTEKAYYVELERILDERYPGLVTKTADDPFGLEEMGDDDDDIVVTPKDGKPAARPAARVTSPVASGDSTVGSGPRRQRGVSVLTAEDVKTMKTFGMDPSNKQHVESFVRDVVSKRRTA